MADDTLLARQVEACLAELARTASPATVSAYRQDLAALTDFLDAQGVDDGGALDVALMRRFLGGERARGLAPRSLARRRAAVARFAEWLRRDGRLAHNPTELVRTPKAPKDLPRPVDVDALARFLDTPHDGSPLAVRDQAMLELFYSSGLRLAELAALDLSDLQPQRVRVLGKGGKPRQVPVGGRARQALDAWLSVRGALAGDGESALFVGARGRRLGHRAIQQRLAQLARRRGLDEHLHPHRLRHSFASHLLESSQDLRAVQELLGHAHLSTTQVYTRLDWQHLATGYDAAHPRARRRPDDSDTSP
ncbi:MULTISPECIES: tyrosine recombinase XerC [Halomonas]|uniref:Tyrosine recombinase XerC n=1 Tax=Halomonas halophila TaxID=29573 RepID=A0ABQ0U5H7_9GAMM|nr:MULTISPECIES: tyrosine recombinase XerC [Halomonas]MDR5889293.1 tyrosine recombinase XerC [Halomonas salina]WJY07153.1 tyrosine recombinase XerC [Halomonas halophila]GEK73707.1 tyrosine recombinase XerC [Halomonas halophila]